MTDIFNNEIRISNTSRIKSKDTKAEMLVRRFLFKSGFRITVLSFLLVINYEMFASISGVVYVGSGEQYTSLTNAGGLFSAINSQAVSGNIIAMITTDLSENGQISLNQWTEVGSGNYRLYIIPCDTATVIKQISGFYNNSNGGLFKLNGADRVIIDGGYYQNGRYLCFTALNNTNGSIFYLTQGASHDTIRNCIVEAGSPSSSATVVGVTFAADFVSGGNSFNAVFKNIFRGNPAISASYLDYAVVSGSYNDTTSCNRYNSLVNNEMSCLRYGAVSVWGGLNFVISGNSIFNNSQTSFTNNFTGIEAVNGGGHIISGNFIGGNGPHCSGTKWISQNNEFYAIECPGNLIGYRIHITNNIFRNYSFNNAEGTRMIYLSGGQIGFLSGNIIGDLTDTASILLPSFSDFAGIYLDFSSSVYEISGNTIGGIVASGSPYVVLLQGIHLESAANQSDTLKIFNNHIHHFYCNASTTGTIPWFCGIGDYSTMTKRIYSGNVIHDLYNTGAGNSNNSITGIMIRNYGGAAIIEKNRIYRLFNNIQNSSVQGVSLFAGNYTLRNNFISLSTEVFPQQINIYGINASGPSVLNIKVLGNSIRIFGSDSNSLNKSVCLNAVTTGSMICCDNILANVRSGIGVKNVIYCSNSINYSGDFNSLYTTGTQFGVVNGFSCANFIQWKANSLQDSNSLVYSPVFQDPENGDMHLLLPSDTVLLKKGVSLAELTYDIDGEARSNDYPDIGADEVILPKICGNIFYLNLDSTALCCTKVFLVDNNEQIADSTTTDTTGYFCFSGPLPGIYNLAFECNLPWGGVNVTDALLILKSFVGSYSLSGLNFEAAKTSPDSLVSAADGLGICRRIVGQITGFTRGDWIFDSAPIIFMGDDIYLSIPALCRGDVNSSFQP